MRVARMLEIRYGIATWEATAVLISRVVVEII
jgi:hypothetical protein